MLLIYQIKNRLFESNIFIQFIPTLNSLARKVMAATVRVQSCSMSLPYLCKRSSIHLHLFYSPSCNNIAKGTLPNSVVSVVALAVRAQVAFLIRSNLSRSRIWKLLRHRDLVIFCVLSVTSLISIQSIPIRPTLILAIFNLL